MFQADHIVCPSEHQSARRAVPIREVQILWGRAEEDWEQHLADVLQLFPGLPHPVVPRPENP